MAKKVKELDFYKYASVDKDCAFLQGVFHENGYKIATDKKILVMAKSKYPLWNEHKLVAKNLLPITEPFVNYKGVIPNFSKMKEMEFDVQRIKDTLKRKGGVLKVYKKLQKKQGDVIFVLSNGALVNDIYMKKIIHFIECYPDARLLAFDDNTKAMCFVSGDINNYNAVCLFVPMLLSNFDDLKQIDDSLYIKRVRASYAEEDILKVCNEYAYLRKLNNLLTEKDKELLEDVHKFMSYL